MKRHARSPRLTCKKDPIGRPSECFCALESSQDSQAGSHAIQQVGNSWKPALRSGAMPQQKSSQPSSKLGYSSAKSTKEQEAWSWMAVHQKIVAARSFLFSRLFGEYFFAADDNFLAHFFKGPDLLTDSSKRSSCQGHEASRGQEQFADGKDA